MLSQLETLVNRITKPKSSVFKGQKNNNFSEVMENAGYIFLNKTITKRFCEVESITKIFLGGF